MVSGDPVTGDRTLDASNATRTSFPPTRDTVIRYMLAQRLDFDPGSRFAYSNFGYMLLGRVIEKISGQAYAAYVRDAVLTPAGLAENSTGRFDAGRAIARRSQVLRLSRGSDGQFLCFGGARNGTGPVWIRQFRFERCRWRVGRFGNRPGKVHCHAGRSTASRAGQRRQFRRHDRPDAAQHLGGFRWLVRFRFICDTPVGRDHVVARRQRSGHEVVLLAICERDLLRLSLQRRQQGPDESDQLRCAGRMGLASRGDRLAGPRPLPAILCSQHRAGGSGERCVFPAGSDCSRLR